MREEIEREREEEVAKLREEVERLKQSQTVTDSDVDIQQPFELDNEAYNVMRSIAFDPFLQRSAPSPGLETIREREIVGGEAEIDTRSPVHMGTHSEQTVITGTQPDPNHSSNDVTPPNASNIIQKPEGPLDTSTPKSGSKLDINYIGRNLTDFDLDTPDGQANPNEQNGMLEREKQSTQATRTDTQVSLGFSHQTESLAPLNDSSRWAMTYTVWQLCICVCLGRLSEAHTTGHGLGGHRPCANSQNGDEFRHHLPAAITSTTLNGFPS